jgi:spermidine synthase
MSAPGGSEQLESAGWARFPAGWSVEKLHPSFGQIIREDKVLYDSKTSHQRLRVLENQKFGRVLTLDGVVQTTEGDEFVYHESLAHIPILAHGRAERVLVVGGGDGGMIREVLKHKAITHVTMVEIDAGVVTFSKEHLPRLSAGAFDDPRLSLVIADGAAFMRDSKEQFDVIIIDSTDPIGPGAALFTRRFYGHAKERLAPGGILVTQNGVPFMQSDELSDTLGIFRDLFDDVTCYLATVPTYVGGPMAFGWGSDNLRARHVDVPTLRARMEAAGLTSLRYYNPEVHKAAFALPNYVKEIVRGPQKPRSRL